MGILEKTHGDIFDRNIALLSVRFPEIVPDLNAPHLDDPFVPYTLSEAHRFKSIGVKQGDGQMLVLCDGGALEKLNEKIAAAEMPEPYDMVFILGMGLGQAGLEVIRRFKKKPRMVILEPYPSLFKLALQTTDLGRLLTYDRLRIYIGNRANADQIIEDGKRILPIGRTLLFIHPYQQQLTGKKYQHLVRDLTHRIRSIRDMWHTTRRFGGQMLEHTIANLPSLLGGAPLRALRDRFKDVPAICVAAGPSLDQALPLLQGVSNTLLIACDSAINGLLQAGILPHIVATADIHPTNTAKLKPHMDRLRNTVLVFGIESNPDNIRSYLGSRRVGMTAYSKLVLDWLDPALDLRCRVPSMTSVTHLAVSLAAAMGANPIVLVGVDLAYLGGQSHSRGSVFTHIPQTENLIAVNGVSGKTVSAPPQLVTDKLILEQHIAQHSARTISTSLNGAFIHGAELKSLKEVIATELTIENQVNKLLDIIPWQPSVGDDVIVSELRKLIVQFKTFENTCARQHAFIRHTLDMQNSRDESVDIADTFSEIKTTNEEFNEKYKMICQILRESVLDELQTIIKNEEIAATKSDRPSTAKMIDALDAIDSHYRAYQNAVVPVLNQLEKLTGDVCKIKALKQVIAANGGSRSDRIALAGYYEDVGETWQAVKEYSQYIDDYPQAPAAYLALIRIYSDAKLWPAARKLIGKARSEIVDSSCCGPLEAQIEREIDGIMEVIKSLRAQGKFDEARKLLNDYLMLRPKDPQAIEFAESLRPMDDHATVGLAIEHGDGSEMQPRFQRAAQYIKDRQFERGIGILEGLANGFPDARPVLREQIGDIRMIQHDDKSAIWNYRQALQPQESKNNRIRSKIQAAELLKGR